jgi:hypothetical protein
MPSSPKKEETLVEQQPFINKREPYQTPDIVYEGTISIRAGSPLPGPDLSPGNPFSDG